MNPVESEYTDIETAKRWLQVFQEIKRRSESEARENGFTLIEAKKIENSRLNRYRDVNPFDHSRIVLKRGGTDYINANIVELERAKRKYILCQGPLANTIGHFWLMVWEQNTKAILMLNKLVEDRNVVKCHMYWPDKVGEEHAMVLKEVSLRVEFVRTEKYSNYVKRFFKLVDLESSKSREIIQFHYTKWPDFGVPSSPIAFLQFLKHVRNSGALDEDVGPAVVHCSAGIGRSGTFCLVDCCLVIIEKEGINKLSVQDVLLELRRFRMGLIQTADQLYFSYKAIIEGAKRLNNSDLDINDDEDEEEIIASDEDNDINPPEPPPRSDSLKNPNAAKPLPTIPSSESVEDELIGIGGVERSERPLPPLPTNQNSLDKVDESESEEMVSDYSESDEEKHNNEEEVNNESKETEALLNGEATAAKESKSSELRKRQRADRHHAMEQKIREIKRKQQEVEAKNTAAKKRRQQIEEK